MGVVFLSGGGVSKSEGNGIPPSFCTNLKIKKTTGSFIAWKNTEGATVYTKSINAADNVPVYQSNGTSLVKIETISAAGGNEITLSDGLVYTKSEGDNITAAVYSLNWKDPQDTILEDQLLATWKGTKIVRRAGNYPGSNTDGTEIADNTTRNAYSAAKFEDIVLDVETEYFYKAFPYSANGVVCLDDRNRFGSATVYEFIIDQSNSNPKSRVKYAGLNEKFSPAFMDYTNDEFKYNSWENAFFLDLFKPCMLKNDGTVDYYLCPTDFSKREDGVTASDISNTSYAGNAMVEVGQIWLKEVNENGKIHVYIANQKVDDDFDCFTHVNADGSYNEFYYRAIYDGSNISNKIRSLSGQTICSNVAGNTQISYAQANGTGWDVDEYCFRRLINYLLILMSKSTDTQTAFGTGRYTGYVNTSNTNQIKTGTLDNRGMFYGDNNNGGVKVFYMENWWGNIWKITNGLIQSGGKLYYKMCPSMQDGSTVTGYQQTAATGYIDSGVTLSGTISELYIKEMQVVPHLGLVPTAASGGSSSTHYCDSMWSNSSVVGFARFGSTPSDGLLVGAFSLAVSNAVSNSGWVCGAALSYRKAS